MDLRMGYEAFRVFGSHRQSTPSGEYQLTLPTHHTSLSTTDRLWAWDFFSLPGLSFTACYASILLEVFDMVSYLLPLCGAGTR